MKRWLIVLFALVVALVTCGVAAEAQSVTGWGLGAHASSSIDASVYQVPPYLAEVPGLVLFRIDDYGDSLTGGTVTGEHFQAVFYDTLNDLGSGVAPLGDGGWWGSVNEAIGGTTCANADTRVKTYGPTLVALGRAQGLPSVGLVQCGTNDIAFQDAGTLPDGAIGGAVEIAGEYAQIAADMRDAGYSKVICEGMIATIYVDPHANPISDFTGASLLAIQAAINALPPGTCDAIIDYTTSNTYPNAGVVDALLGATDGGSASANCSLPPDPANPAYPGSANTSSYTNTCERLDGITHFTRNGDDLRARCRHARTFAGVMGYDAGVGTCSLPLDPSWNTGGFPITQAEDIDGVHYSDDQAANQSGGPLGPYHALAYSYDAGVEILTPLGSCWGTGSVLFDAGTQNANLAVFNNYATPGATCASLIAGRATVDAHISSHAKVIVSQCGTNDLINGTPPTGDGGVCGLVQTLTIGSVTAGWPHAYAETIEYTPALPSASVDALNNCLRAVTWPTPTKEKLIDVAADPQLSAALGTVTRSVFYSDADGGLENANGGTRHAQVECAAIQDGGFR